MKNLYHLSLDTCKLNIHCCDQMINLSYIFLSEENANLREFNIKTSVDEIISFQNNNYDYHFKNLDLQCLLPLTIFEKFFLFSKISLPNLQRFSLDLGNYNKQVSINNKNYENDKVLTNFFQNNSIFFSSLFNFIKIQPSL